MSLRVTEDFHRAKAGSQISTASGSALGVSVAQPHGVEADVNLREGADGGHRIHISFPRGKAASMNCTNCVYRGAGILIEKFYDRWVVLSLSTLLG